MQVTCCSWFCNFKASDKRKYPICNISFQYCVMQIFSKRSSCCDLIFCCFFWSSGKIVLLAFDFRNLYILVSASICSNLGPSFGHTIMQFSILKDDSDEIEPQPKKSKITVSVIFCLAARFCVQLCWVECAHCASVFFFVSFDVCSLCISFTLLWILIPFLI